MSEKYKVLLHDKPNFITLTVVLLAGLTAGIGAGVKARKAGGDFWSGKGANYEKLNTDLNLPKVKNGYKKTPTIDIEGNYQDWTEGVKLSENKIFYRLRNYKLTDWSMTFRGNAISIGRDLQQIGNPIFNTGYGLSLTGVYAPIGGPIATLGGGISATGSLLESAGNQNWNNFGVSIGRAGTEVASKNLINRIPYLNSTSKIILKQDISFKFNFIENFINGK